MMRGLEIMGTPLPVPSLEVSCQAAHPEIVNSVDRHFLKFIEVLMAENYRVVYLRLEKIRGNSQDYF